MSDKTVGGPRMNRSGKHNRTYIVRGFNPLTQGPFVYNGLMSNLTTYAEKRVSKQHEAITAICLDFTPMAGRNIPDTFTIEDKNTLPECPPVVVIDLYIDTCASSADDLRKFRKDVEGVVKIWAEKSRMMGERGWRVSAVKSLKIEKTGDSTVGDRVTIKTQVILGTTIFYNHNRATIGHGVDLKTDFEKDLIQMHRYLSDVLGRFYTTIRYEHSIHGKGDLTYLLSTMPAHQTSPQTFRTPAGDGLGPL